MISRHAGDHPRPIRDMVEKKMTLEQVKAARPTLDYDGRYGPTPGRGRRRCSSRRSIAMPPRRPRRKEGAKMNMRLRVLTPQAARARCVASSRHRRSALDRRQRRGGRRRRGRRHAAHGARAAGGLHRHLGVGRHRGLALAHGHAAEGRRRQHPVSAEGARPRGVGSRGRQRAATSARRSASAASCGSQDGCASRGRTTTR